MGVKIDPIKLEEECSVCLDFLKDAETYGPAKELICGHIFHENCFKRWELHDKNGLAGITCPLCRDDKSPREMIPIEAVRPIEFVEPVAANTSVLKCVVIKVRRMWSLLFSNCFTVHEDRSD